MTSVAPAKILTPCQGDGVLAVVRLGDHRTGEPPVVIAYDACPGCDDCSTAARVARLAATPPAEDPFAGLPTVDDGEAW
jgi:hypothetical protein